MAASVAFVALWLVNFSDQENHSDEKERSVNGRMPRVAGGDIHDE